MANELTMVRGDSLVLAIDALDENGDAYEPAAEDTITLTVREWNDEGTIALRALKKRHVTLARGLNKRKWN